MKCEVIPKERGDQMICENIFNELMERAKGYTYSSMNYLEFDECKNAEILADDDGLILLQDKSKIPMMIYFATDNFEKIVKIIAKMSGHMRLHFVPKEYVKDLQELGFAEWGEYADFWNTDLVRTAEKFGALAELNYLSLAECGAASVVTTSCMLQSRGFEGALPEFYEEWLNKGNHVIIQRVGSVIAGVCCVTIYDNGTTLHIREIAVGPKYQGRGLGKKLMEQGIKYGVENGAVKGFLLADVLNENAIDLYRKYDFYLKDGETELQMLRD